MLAEEKVFASSRQAILFEQTAINSQVKRRLDTVRGLSTSITRNTMLTPSEQVHGTTTKLLELFERTKLTDANVSVNQLKVSHEFFKNRCIHQNRLCA